MPPRLPSPSVLQQVRKARRWSQLELSFRLGVSQRHVSFVESGRARPSRGLLMAWLRELDAPLAMRNHALLHAGYAPAYGTVPIDDPALAQASDALEHLLRAHDPMPALVIGTPLRSRRCDAGRARSLRAVSWGRQADRAWTLRPV